MMKKVRQKLTLDQSATYHSTFAYFLMQKQNLATPVYGGVFN